jgi:hypothetical protein
MDLKGELHLEQETDTDEEASGSSGMTSSNSVLRHLMRHEADAFTTTIRPGEHGRLAVIPLNGTPGLSPEVVIISASDRLAFAGTDCDRFHLARSEGPLRPVRN